MKQTITIDIDLPDGYEIVSYRCPRNGEMFLKQDQNEGVVANWDWQVMPANRRFILRRAFVWPSWLKCAAIAKDIYGVWYAYKAMPKQCLSGFAYEPGSLVQRIDANILDIDLPDVPWDQSLRINPEYKGGAK